MQRSRPELLELQCAGHASLDVTGNGASLGSITVPNTPEGLFQLHQFAVPFAIRRWAIEGAGNHFIAAFVSQLLEQSETVYSIPPSLTSQYRSRRGRKKNDMVDAENVEPGLAGQPAIDTSSQQGATTRVAGVDTRATTLIGTGKILDGEHARQEAFLGAAAQICLSYGSLLGRHWRHCTHPEVRATGSRTHYTRFIALPFRNATRFFTAMSINRERASLVAHAM